MLRDAIAWAMVSSVPLRRGKSRTPNYSAISYDVIILFLRNSLLQIEACPILSLVIDGARCTNEIRDPAKQASFPSNFFPRLLRRVADVQKREMERKKIATAGSSELSVVDGFWKGFAIHASRSYRDGNRKRYCNGPFTRSLARRPIRRVKDKQEL